MTATTAPGAPHPAAAPSRYATLLSPLDLGRFEVRNRIVMGSMHVGLEDHPGDVSRLAAYLGERARGGAGLIVTGGFSPNRSGRLTPNGAQASEHLLAKHDRITREVHEADGRILLQLLHAGRYAFHPLAASASAGRSPISPFRARRLTRAGLRRTVAQYGLAARRARAAGYDGIEIMGSEGYLLNQFLAPRTNRRRDRYGRDAEARRALPLAIAETVREALGTEGLLSYRISLTDLVEDGQDWEETLALARELTARGVDVLSSGIGWHESRVPTIVTSVPRGAFVPLTARLREEVRVPVIASNRLHDPDLAEAVLERGEVDLISMSRPLLADPHLPRKLAEGRAGQVVSCIACNQACLDKIFAGKRASCLVNPRAAHETELVLTPVRPRRAKRVAVVGAGPAGLEAALAAAERGHRVTLLEAREEIGGQLRLAARIPGKEDYGLALRSWRMRLAEAGVEVHLGVRATPAELTGYDEVVVATGVTPRLPELPGFAPSLTAPEAGPQVVTYMDLLEERVVPGERVAIIGAGGIGVDVAEFLSAAIPSPTLTPELWREHWGVIDPAERRGGLRGRRPRREADPSATEAPEPPRDGRRAREIHLLQRKDTKIGAGLGRTTGWVHRAELRRAGVIEHRGVSYEKVDAEGLHITEDGEERVLDVDTVVLCAGQLSVDELAEQLREHPSGRAPRVHVIGGADVAAELDAERAIRQATEVAAAL